MVAESSAHLLPEHFFDWERVVHLALVSRSLDDIEETQLLPEKKIFYQFSARGHEVSQALLGTMVTDRHDAVTAYYRCRPMMLALGFDLVDAFASPMGKAGGLSDGRDIGVVYNLARHDGPIVFPMAGDVGSQYTPAAGWAQAIRYHRTVLKDPSYERSIAVVMGGDGSVATNGFWSALNIATTQKLPLLFYIEDNGYGLSVPATFQTPGGNIATNLSNFGGLKVLDVDGSEIAEVTRSIVEAVNVVRGHEGPVLLRVVVPRLAGHSGQDTQAYKSADQISVERSHDPLGRLKDYLVPSRMSQDLWNEITVRVRNEVAAALDAAIKRKEPPVEQVQRYVYVGDPEDSAPTSAGDGIRTKGMPVGGLPRDLRAALRSSEVAAPEPQRINMLTAIRRTLEAELRANPRVLVFGEDVGPKGGVHAATMGLQIEFGSDRVFDTSLSEEGIIGRAVGLAIAGLMPVPEIQFRKYLDAGTEQFNNCGTIRWRTANQFSAPIVVRMPVGFSKCGDPWHSISAESVLAHSLGWYVAYPSNAEDATGLLRAALRGETPTVFLEHRTSLDAAWSRRPYPGDAFIVPFGKGRFVQRGGQFTVVTWGALVERCEAALKVVDAKADIIDLRTIVPWDREMVLASVRATRRCLIVHEDTRTGGFGGEISAVISEEAFLSLDAPIIRIAVPDIPLPYNAALLESVVPSVELIATKMEELLEF